MKAFVLWAAATLLGFGSLGGAYHWSLSENPRAVLVIVDSSFAMQPAWHRVARRLEEIADRRYSRFGLITEKSRVHGWQAELGLGRLAPYAPRDLTRLAAADGFPELAEANEVYFVTNAPDDQLEALPDWTIVRP